METNNTSFRQTLEQSRAKAAWEMIGELRGNDSKYKTVVEAAPALIQSTGLGQAMAFYAAKEGKTYVKHVSQWVLSEKYEGTTKIRDNGKGVKDLIHEITEKNSSRYRQLTEEAMAITGWLKRFAVMKFKDKKDND